MDFIEQLSPVWVIIGGFATVMGGGVAVYFLIKYQINKNLEATVKIYKEEVAALTTKVTRLQNDITELLNENTRLRGDNDNLKFKKNYLKDIVMQALTSKQSIDKSMLDELNEVSSKTSLPK